MRKSADAFRSIGEVSRLVGVPPHVLRYWETQFPQLAPVKRADGRRYYRPEDLHLAAGLCELLRKDGMTTRGAARVIAQDKGAMVRARGLARLPERFRGEAEMLADQHLAENEKAESTMPEAPYDDPPPQEPLDDATSPTSSPSGPGADGPATQSHVTGPEAASVQELPQHSGNPAPARTEAPEGEAAPSSPNLRPAESQSPSKRPSARSTDLPLFPGLAPAAPPPGVWLPRLAAAAEALRGMPPPRRPTVQMLRLRDRVAALIEPEF